MFIPPKFSTLIITVYTLAVGTIGAALAYWLSFPVYILLGPAILVSIISLFGIRFAVADSVRDIAFFVNRDRYWRRNKP